MSGIRRAELPDPAAEAQAIALALREALETPGKTAALVTPDRQLAARVSGLLARWGIEADDSAGKKLSETPAGTLLLGIASAAAEELAPVPLLALLKHPLVGGEDDDRLSWLDAVRKLDLKLRGPRPAAGIAGLDAHFGSLGEWQKARPRVGKIDGLLGEPLALAALAGVLADAAQALADDRAWRGPAGGSPASCSRSCSRRQPRQQLMVSGGGRRAVAPPAARQGSGSAALWGHPRIFIWGLLEARLQRADLVVLGGLNEGVWPALPAPDPWLPPKVRATLELADPGLQDRPCRARFCLGAGGSGGVAHSRPARCESPTVASRFLLRLDAISGSGLPRDVRLERITQALDDPGPPQPVDRPAPSPPAEQRPDRISVTAVDRLKADPFAFYAQAILGIRKKDPVDDDHNARWKGTAVHKVLEEWQQHDNCDPDRLRPRAERLLARRSDPPDAARALGAAAVGGHRLDRRTWSAPTRPRGEDRCGPKPTARPLLAGVTVYGRADRIDRLRRRRPCDHRLQDRRSRPRRRR